MINDTIVALATPNMKSAISIIRISGSQSIELVNKITNLKLDTLASNTINYGFITYENQKIDEVLISIFRAPKSFTTEDVIEINTHGGIAVSKKILEIIISLGARLADRGEFSQRAYLNGRIDLLEVEAINDMIEADSEQSLGIAIAGLSQESTRLVKSFKEELLSIIAHIEVKIDYPEYDDIEDLSNPELQKLIKEFKLKIEAIIKSSKTSNIIKNGINIAIIGQPNVGKSSLLNAFLEDDKAIVTDIAGTTRDLIEASYQINGIKVNFIDTAGIRETKDIIEQKGIEKSIKALENADIILLVIDGSVEQSITFEQDLIKNNDNVITVINKSDLKTISTYQGVVISALNNNIEPLKEAIINKIELNTNVSNEQLFLSNTRHLALLRQINTSLENALQASASLMPSDIIAQDLEEAYDLLQALLGAKYDNTLIQEMFSKFCLGK